MYNYYEFYGYLKMYFEFRKEIEKKKRKKENPNLNPNPKAHLRSRSCPPLPPCLAADRNSSPSPSLSLTHPALSLLPSPLSPRQSPGTRHRHAKRVARTPGARPRPDAQLQAPIAQPPRLEPRARVELTLRPRPPLHTAPDARSPTLATVPLR
jgi:hypothetical protein